MSYPVKYRERTIEYRQEGHTLGETSKTFEVAVTTIREWEKQLKEEGDLTPKVPTRGSKKRLKITRKKRPPGTKNRITTK